MRYYIADLHNYDECILMYEHRPYKNSEDMRSMIINNWNLRVGREDEVFLLGDIGDPEILKELNGKIYIVLGNHDVYDDVLKISGTANIEISRFPIMNDVAICSHEPVVSMPEEFPYLNIHGHTHSLSYGKYTKTWLEGRRHFCVSMEQIGYVPISEYEIGMMIQYPFRAKRPDGHVDDKQEK